MFQSICGFAVGNSSLWRNQSEACSFNRREGFKSRPFLFPKLLEPFDIDASARKGDCLRLSPAQLRACKFFDLSNPFLYLVASVEIEGSGDLNPWSGGIREDDHDAGSGTSCCGSCWEMSLWWLPLPRELKF